MKRNWLLLCVLVLTIAVLTGCTSPVAAEETAPVLDGSELSDCPPSVMVAGKTYYCFSERAETAPEDGEIAGYIHSCVDLSGMPTENDQSNFPACVDQPYAWVDGQLLLYYAGQWNVCQPANQV